MKLFQELHEVGLYAIGALRADRRGFPNDQKGCVKKKFKERGKCNICRSRINTNLSVGVSQDTKVVMTCTTFCQTNPLSEVQRKMKNGERHTFSCPEAIQTYNKYVRGVDKNDQLREYHHVRLKSRKYYVYLFWMMFDVAIIGGCRVGHLRALPD